MHILSVVFWTLLLISSFTPPALADIYRFVTIDGVETFTDSPTSKGATVVIKERIGAPSKKRGNVKTEKVHDISLDEIARKAVMAALNPQESDRMLFDPHLPAVGGVVTSTVGMRIDPLDGVWRHHNGVDIAIPTGTPVKPVAAGMVVYSGTRSGYGNTVLVEHENGMVTLYAHNSSLMVSEGHLVTPDSIIALSGSTGRSTGPHLHFEAWLSGKNVTNAFLPGSNVKLPVSMVATNNQRSTHFRSETLSDGSVLFTNLPPTSR